MSTLTHESRSSPSAPPHIPIKCEYDEYINDVPQDLRTNSASSSSSIDSVTKEQQVDGFHRTTNGSPTVDRKTKETTQGTNDDRTTSGSPGVDPRPKEEPHGEERLCEDPGMNGSTGNGHTNGSTGIEEQPRRPEGRPMEEMYPRTDTNAVNLNMIHGEAVRNISSREELPDGKFSPAGPETPDCNSQQSEDMLLSSNEDFAPQRDRDGNLVLDVDCGSNSGYLYINKLCQGSKGQSIYFDGKWCTPNEFQYISGRETAKDWKRSIRHRGKSLKILMSRGLLSVHTSAASECSNCKMNMAMSRVRFPEKKSASSTNLLTVPTSTTMSTVFDKSQRRSIGDTDAGSLNHIISQLHQTNGFASDSHRKRALLLQMGSDNKRPRSASSMEDDIYEEQQTKIFQAANSPEPQLIENVTRSLNISTVGSGPPSPASLSPPSLEDQVNGLASDTRDFIIRSPQSLTKHQNKSSRKQISPQHIDLTNAEKEASRSQHILFGSGGATGSNNYHKQTVMRQRYHSHAYNLSRNSASNMTPNDTSRRTQSLLTPKTSDTPMIELTRPDLAANGSSGGNLSERSKASGVTSTSQVTDDGAVTSRRLSTGDTVFFPSDMSSWTVDDVVQFVQSLKGCEEYAQLFREQAIDGEILPVLTEDHLLQNMGMKLGPALKIRLHIAKRLGFTLNGQYCSLKTPYEDIH